MRQTQANSCASSSRLELPLRLKKVVELPLLFAGERDEIRYAAALPPRVRRAASYFFRLAVVREGDKSRLVLERT